jgi:peptide-methionine (R)-S-oxide reductase
MSNFRNIDVKPFAASHRISDQMIGERTMAMQFTKRQMLRFAGMGAIALTFGCGEGADARKGKFAFTKTDAEWRKILSPAAYKVLRQEDTEWPYSSSLETEKRKGTFVCAGCAKRLFSSAHKYDSGTGWPSFWQPLAGAVGTATDYKLGYARTEVHCARCGGHLGHVFNDGPKPTGKRYCMNGVAMKFIAG